MNLHICQARMRCRSCEICVHGKLHEIKGSCCFDCGMVDGKTACKPVPHSGHGHIPPDVEPPTTLGSAPGYRGEGKL